MASMQLCYKNHTRLVFLAFFLSCASLFSSEPYSHFIKEVINDGYLIQLSDGSVWQVHRSSFQLYDPIEEAKTWEKGEVVSLMWEPYPDAPRRKIFYLFNPRTKHAICVYRVKEHPKELSTQVIKEIDPKGYYILLDDGSYWEIGWWDSFMTWYWKVGERILIFKTPAGWSSKGHALMNLDCKGDCYVNCVEAENLKKSTY